MLIKYNAGEHMMEEYKKDFCEYAQAIYWYQKFLMELVWIVKIVSIPVLSLMKRLNYAELCISTF